jgi:LmbE family N-acetylglucosaminyl deacetylase
MVLPQVRRPLLFLIVLLLFAFPNTVSASPGSSAQGTVADWFWVLYLSLSLLLLSFLLHRRARAAAERLKENPPHEIPYLYLAVRTPNGRIRRIRTKKSPFAIGNEKHCDVYIRNMPAGPGKSGSVVFRYVWNGQRAAFTSENSFKLNGVYTREKALRRGDRITYRGYRFYYGGINRFRPKAAPIKDYSLVPLVSGLFSLFLFLLLGSLRVSHSLSGPKTAVVSQPAASEPEKPDASDDPVKSSSTEVSEKLPVAVARESVAPAQDGPSPNKVPAVSRPSLVRSNADRVPAEKGASEQSPTKQPVAQQNSVELVPPKQTPAGSPAGVQPATVQIPAEKTAVEQPPAEPATAAAIVPAVPHASDEPAAERPSAELTAAAVSVAAVPPASEQRSAERPPAEAVAAAVSLPTVPPASEGPSAELLPAEPTIAAVSLPAVPLASEQASAEQPPIEPPAVEQISAKQIPPEPPTAEQPPAEPTPAEEIPVVARIAGEPVPLISVGQRATGSGSLPSVSREISTAGTSVASNPSTGDPAAGAMGLRRVTMIGPGEPIPTIKADILFIHTHPDDESLDFGGLMAKASRHGKRIVTLILTDGEGGLDRYPERGVGGIYPAYFLEGEELARVRVWEATSALSILGSELYVRMGLPNHPYRTNNDVLARSMVLLRWGGQVYLQERIRQIIEQLQPELVIAPDFDSARHDHFEHKTVGYIVHRAMKNPAEFVKGYLVAVDSSDVSPAVEHHRIDLSGADPPSGLSYKEIQMAALREYRSQREVIAMGLEVLPQTRWENYRPILWNFSFSLEEYVSRTITASTSAP